MNRGCLYRYTLLIWLTILPSAVLRAGGADQEVALPSLQAKSQAEKSSQPEQPQKPSLSVTVQDDTGVAVPSARLELVKAGTQTSYKGETDYSGRCEFVA